MGEGTGASIIGQQIGIYQVRAFIGAGGMGEVYQARDTKLGRDVAIKILPRELASNADRIAQLDREARILAALNHPSIATIHGFEDFKGTPALVLELIEGPSLVERVGRRPLPVTDTLSIARQIADALEAAHEKGVVHRDLKPANIKITPQGRVKVLDFGLAKMRSVAASADLSGASTLQATTPDEAQIAGTPAYMSPEQARGENVDRTTDNWAFGCVLFEMLTGAAAFTGETIPDILSGILRSEPSWELLPADTPLPLRLLLKRCLQKDRSRRLQFIGDARVEIDQLLTDPVATSDVSREPSVQPARRSPAWITATFLLVLLAIVSVPAFRYFRAPAVEVRPVLFEIQNPNGPGVRISPDGRQIA